MPDQPTYHRFGGWTQQEDAFEWDEHVVEPHLAVELVVAAAERCDEGIGIAHRDLAADGGDTGCIDRNDESGAMLADVEAGETPDIKILGIGRAGVHADLAANDNAGVGLFDDLQRDPRLRILAHAGADIRSATAESQKSPAVGDHLAIVCGFGDLLR